jgi:hypothetical protein
MQSVRSVVARLTQHRQILVGILPWHRPCDVALVVHVKLMIFGAALNALPVGRLKHLQATLLPLRFLQQLGVFGLPFVRFLLHHLLHYL